MLKCNSCGGTYPDTSDGSAPHYMHVCPEQIVDKPEQVNEKNEIVKPATFKPTPNPRNENLIPHPTEPGKHVMISEGSGVTLLTPRSS